MNWHLGNKSFIKHHEQAFDQHPIISSYKEEESAFLKTVKRVHRLSIFRDANIVSSQVFYKIKVLEDNVLASKARIAPHGNEEAMRDDLKFDCSMWPLTEIQIIASTAAIRNRKIVEADAKIAFLNLETQNRTYM